MIDLYLPVVVPILATVIWYLASSAELTRAIWSKYPVWFDRWARCPACSGTWWGGGIAVILEIGPRWTFFGIGGLAGAILAALWSTFWVPILSCRMYTDLIAMHPQEEEDDAATRQP